MMEKETKFKQTEIGMIPEDWEVKKIEEIGISEDGIKFNLSKLKKENKIRRVGPDKGGHWEIIWWNRRS